MNKKYILGIIAVIVLVVLGGLYCFKKNTKELISAPQNQPVPRVIGGLDSYGTPASLYTADETNVYYDGKKIYDADPKTFEIVKGSLLYMKDYIRYDYARDDKEVYYKGRALVVPVNPSAFAAIENGYGVHSYGTDGTNIFFEEMIISGADPKTFEPLWEHIYEGCRKTEYSKDVTHVYYKYQIVPGADPKTFESLLHGFGKDSFKYYKDTTFLGRPLTPEELECNYG